MVIWCLEFTWIFSDDRLRWNSGDRPVPCGIYYFLNEENLLSWLKEIVEYDYTVPFEESFFRKERCEYDPLERYDITPEGVIKHVIEFDGFPDFCDVSLVRTMDDPL